MQLEISRCREVVWRDMTGAIREGKPTMRQLPAPGRAGSIVFVEKLAGGKCEAEPAIPGLDASLCRCPDCRPPGSPGGTWWRDELQVNEIFRLKRGDTGSGSDTTASEPVTQATGKRKR